MCSNESLVQGSEDWLNARIGSLGASSVHEIMAKTRNGRYGASRANCMARMVTERITGQRVEAYVTDAMRRGSELEYQARPVYEINEYVNVVEVGLFLHPSIKGTHASPDGLVGKDGLLEIKMPNTSTHIDTLLTGKIKDQYIKQMQWQMACTGRKWCDFVSYDPRLGDGLSYFRKRVVRDSALIEEMETEVTKFLEELAEKVKALEALRG